MEKEMIIKQIYDMDAETYRALLSMKGEDEFNAMVNSIDSLIAMNYIYSSIPQEGINQSSINVIADNRVDKMYEFTRLVRNDLIPSNDVCYLKTLLVKMLSYSKGSISFAQNADCFKALEDVRSVMNPTNEEAQMKL